MHRLEMNLLGPWLIRDVPLDFTDYSNLIITVSGPLTCSRIRGHIHQKDNSLHSFIHTSSQISSLWFWFPHATKLTFCFFPVPDFFEDGLPLPAQAYLKVCSAVSEANLNDVKPSSPPAIMDSPVKEAGLPSSGTTVQRTSVLHTQEIVRFENPKFHLDYKCTIFLSFIWIY